MQARVNLTLAILVGLLTFGGVTYFYYPRIRGAVRRALGVGQRSPRAPKAERAKPEIAAKHWQDPARTAEAGGGEKGQKGSPPGVAEVIPQGGGISGRVVDESGNSIAGVALWAERVEDRKPDQTADREGNYRFSGLPAGTYFLRARDPSGVFLPGRQEKLEVSDGKTLERIDLVLRRGESLSGRLVGTDGKPVAGAEVTAIGHGPGARSDDAGYFTVTGLPAGKAHLEVIKKGFETVISEAAVPGRDLLFTMVPLGTISGLVRARGQVALPRFRIAVSCRFPDGSSLDSSVDCDDPGGRFEISGKAGVYLLTARVPGFAPGESAEIALAAHERKEGVAIVLVRAEKVGGRVIARGSGKPIPGAQVSIGPSANSGGPGLRGGRNVSTGPDGRFVIEEVPEGRVDLRAEHPDFARAELRDVAVQAGKRSEITLALGGGGQIRGIVRRADRPVSGARISALRLGDARSIDALTDAEGLFAVKGLEEGDYSVRVMAATDSGAYADMKTVQLVVRAGQATEVDIETGARVKLRGRVTAGGVPLPGGAVRAERPEAGESAIGGIGPSGEFSLDLHGSGRYLLTVSGAAYGPSGARFQALIPEGTDEARQDLHLLDGEIHGVVGDAASGEPIPDARVWALPRGEDFPGSPLALYRSAKSVTVADAWGRFVLPNLGPGVYTLCGFAPGKCGGSLDLVRVDERGRSATVALHLESAQRFLARIAGAEGKPLAGAKALLRTLTGGPVRLEPAISGDDGVVALEAPREGSYRLTVLHPSHAPWKEQINLTASPDGIPVALKQGGKLRLTVLNSRGRPVEGAGVRVIDGGDEDLIEDLVLLQQDLRRPFVTQFDGSLVLDQILPGAYRVAAERGAVRSPEQPIQVVAERPAEITLTIPD